MDDIYDKSYVYQVLLSQGEIYNNRLKLFFKLPIIVFSAILGVLNSNTKITEDYSMTIINPVFNILTTLILSLTSVLSFEAKVQDFNSSRKKFMKLATSIEQKLLNDKEDISLEFVNSCQLQYEQIVESINFDIEYFICQRVREEYKGKKTLPMIINNYKKDERNRSKSITIDEEDFLKMNRLDSVLVYNSPRVLDVKKIDNLQI
jgi:hypothetical protein